MCSSLLNLKPKGRVGLGQRTVTTYFLDSSIATSFVIVAETTGSGGNTPVMINTFFFSSIQEFDDLFHSNT